MQIMLEVVPMPPWLTDDLKLSEAASRAFGERLVAVVALLAAKTLAAFTVTRTLVAAALAGRKVAAAWLVTKASWLVTEAARLIAEAAAWLVA